MINCTFKYFSSLGCSALKVNKFLLSSCQMILHPAAGLFKDWYLLRWLQGTWGRSPRRHHREAVAGISFQGSKGLHRLPEPCMVTCFWTGLVWEVDFWKAGPGGCINPPNIGGSQGTLEKWEAEEGRNRWGCEVRCNLQACLFTPIHSRLSLNGIKISPNPLYLSSGLLGKSCLPWKVVGKGTDTQI